MKNQKHEFDFRRFGSLSPEHLYWTLEYLLSQTNVEGSARDVPWADVADHVSARARIARLRQPAPAVAAMKRVLPLARQMLRSQDVALKYSFWCQLLPDAWFTFMNYGYCDPALDTRHFNATEKLWRFAPCMYEVTASVPLEGKRVLEVGCGRGGGAALLARSRKPVEYVGLDLTRSNVMFCQQTHRLPNLQFTCGSALKLPWKDESFDVLINIESAPYYHPLQQFSDEAHRVLVEGGALCLATYSDLASHRRLRRTLVKSGFALESEVDISAQTAEALRLHRAAAGVLRRAKTERAPGLYRDAFGTMYAVPELTDGRKPYVRYVFRKKEAR